MKNINYRNQFNLFITEIIDLGVNEFKNPENWKLSKDPLNGVTIGYELPTKSSRLLLHEVGQKHGLIPLCPDDIIEVKMSKEYTPEGFFIVSMHGELIIKKRK